MHNKAKVFIALTAIVALFMSFLVAPASAAGETVSVWMTTADQSQLLQPQPNLTFATDSGANPVTVDVDPALVYQKIDGFGASLTDSSAYLICNKLTAAQRDPWRVAHLRAGGVGDVDVQVRCHGAAFDGAR